MKTFGLLFLVGFVVLQSCKPQMYGRETLLGTWVTNVDEPLDGKCTIEFTAHNDNTTSYQFLYENGDSFSGRGLEWKYKCGVFREKYGDGSRGVAKIKWIDENKFDLVILKNQKTELYKGRIRTYERKRE
ncbi:MAG: hypothetical protein EAZ55_14100 [Cytophagales bacterium]|nr:MAG: hypothetical protein EAZ55_14100 [Cytophagales bacterium]